MTVVVLYGPKAAGKSQVADALHTEHGIAHVDADALVLDLMAKGAQPQPQHGWLTQVEEAVTAALRGNPTVPVEATGAWSSDWQLADDFKATGQRVVQLDPRAARGHAASPRRTNDPKAPVTEDDARLIWTAACGRAGHRHFDLVLDTSQLRQEDLPRAVAPPAAVLST